MIHDIIYLLLLAYTRSRLPQLSCRLHRYTLFRTRTRISYHDTSFSKINSTLRHSTVLQSVAPCVSLGSDGSVASEKGKDHTW